jgi:hypothetical protein
MKRGFVDLRRRLAILAGSVILIGVLSLGHITPATGAAPSTEIEIFVRDGCPHCDAAKAFVGDLAGAIHLKDFAAFGRGISLSIPAAAKPGIYARLRTILHAQSLWPALVGTAVLAVLVQIVELLCTSGFPALYTRILTVHQLDRPAYYGYLLLYNLMYMLDDIVILAVGVVTLSQRRLQEKEGRLLKLVAGLVMLGLGIYLLVPR